MRSSPKNDRTASHPALAAAFAASVNPVKLPNGLVSGATLYLVCSRFKTEE
jgi:hypothetical protein